MINNKLADRYAALIDRHKHNREGACWHLIVKRLWILRHGPAYENFTPFGCERIKTLKTR